MAGARLEDCAEWLQMASAQKNNNQMAIWGSRRLTEKIVVRQSSCHASQKKNCGTAINGLCWPKEKIAARQSGYHAGLFKKIAVRQLGYRASLFKNHSAAIGVSRRPLQKSQRSNRSIAPAK